jgi:hypothetical protein
VNPKPIEEQVAEMASTSRCARATASDFNSRKFSDEAQAMQGVLP